MSSIIMEKWRKEEEDLLEIVVQLFPGCSARKAVQLARNELAITSLEYQNLMNAVRRREKAELLEKAPKIIATLRAAAEREQEEEMSSFFSRGGRYENYATTVSEDGSETNSGEVRYRLRLALPVSRLPADTFPTKWDSPLEKFLYGLFGVTAVEETAAIAAMSKKEVVTLLFKRAEDALSKRELLVLAEASGAVDY